MAKNPMQILFNNPKVKLVGASMIPVTNKLPDIGPNKTANPSNRAGRQYTHRHVKGPK